MEASAKYKLVEKIINTKDEVLLEEIKSLLGLSDKDFWDELTEVTKASINKGLEQSSGGETIPHEQIVSRIKSGIK